jgi:hypothetical protein
MIDDVRAALDWAYAPFGNVELGVALTVASLPFGFQLSLIDEFKKRAILALDNLSQVSPPRPLWEIRINNALVETFCISRSVCSAQKRGAPTCAWPWRPTIAR